MPLAPPVIKIVLLVSFIIKYVLSYVAIYKSHSTLTRRLRRLMGGLRINAHSQDPARAIAGAGLLASAFPIMSASIFRAKEAGTRAFMIRFIRPGIIIERFSRIALSPSDTHCSAFIGFMGMVSAVRPSFASTGVSVNPGDSTVTYMPMGLNSM